MHFYQKVEIILRLKWKMKIEISFHSLFNYQTISDHCDVHWVVTISLFRQMKIQKGVDRQPSLMSHLLFFHQSTENISTIHTANEYCTLTKCFHNVRVLPGQNVCCFWVSKRIYKSCLQEFVAFPMTLSLVMGFGQ